MSDIIRKIFDFNEQVIGIAPDHINPLTEEQRAWYEKFVQEELAEFNEAFAQQDIVGMVDAVGDLIYGAMGMFKKMGLSVDQTHASMVAIHIANMTKKRGNKGRGSDEDAIKPEGFVPPEEAIGHILFGA